jgi:hypothetical protein
MGLEIRRSLLQILGKLKLDYTTEYWKGCVVRGVNT